MHEIDQVTRNMFTLVPTVNKPLFDAVQAARIAAVGDAKIGGWYGIVTGQPFAEFHNSAAAQGVCARLCLGSNHPAGLAGAAKTTPVPCSSNWTERRSCALAVCRGRRILEAIV